MERAFTLIELLIVLGLMAVMFLVLNMFFVSTHSAIVYQDALMDVSGSSSAVVNAVGEAVRPATRIVGTHAFASGTHATDGGALVVEVPSIDEDGAAIADAYDYVAFYRDGSDVYAETAADSSSSRDDRTKLLARNASSLTFAYDTDEPSTATLVTLRIETEGSAVSRTASSSAQATFYLRNTP